MAPTTPLLLPLLSEGQPQPDTHLPGSATFSEAQLCHALIARVAQTHPIVIADLVGLDDLGTQLEHLVQQDVTRILVLPWHLHAVTALMVQQAMTALHRTGAATVSASSRLLTHPVTIPGVSPAGPLGGLLPPHARLDRCVEQWPGWQHTSTVVRSEQAAILIVHTASSYPVRQRDPLLSVNLDRLKQALLQICSHRQHEPESSGNDRALHRDSAIYARYLSDIVVAALDALTSLPPIRTGQQE
jgi:hypothetical protein